MKPKLWQHILALGQSQHTLKDVSLGNLTQELRHPSAINHVIIRSGRLMGRSICVTSSIVNKLDKLKRLVPVIM